MLSTVNPASEEIEGLVIDDEIVIKAHPSTILECTDQTGMIYVYIAACTQ